MPNSLLAADTLFPKIDEDKTQNENLRTVTNYLYMLVEELRYTFNNLGTDNFNDTALDELAKIITEPVYVQLADDEGNISALMVQTDSLFSRMQDAEGNISSVTQMATAMQTRLQSAEGNISTLTQTAESIEGRVSSVEGEYTTLSLTLNGLTLTDKYGTTYLNGNMLSTGTVTADNLNGEQIYVYGSDSSTIYGILYAGTNRVGSTAFELYGTNGIRVSSADYQNVFIQAGGSNGPFIKLSPNSNAYANDEYILFDGAPVILGGASYGTSLPSSGQAGQIFFLKG